MTPNTETLEQLADKARQGDHKAFSELMKIKMNDILSLTYRMTRDSSAAADLAQETFIAAWENLRNFRGESSISSWLYRIAANRTLNFLQREKRFERFDDDAFDRVPASVSPDDPGKAYEQGELQREVAEFMQTLPVQQRIAFELRFYKEQSFAEISETTGSALGTVKTNYREAIKKLRKYAQQKGWHK